MAQQKYEHDDQLPLIDEPIGWVELAQHFAEHEQLHHDLEAAKSAVKELKARYEESQNTIILAGKRVRRTAQREAMQLTTRALRNRGAVPEHVDPTTGEIREGQTHD